jgi:glycosyltransferase involved in cell wall biosynthesis
VNRPPRLPGAPAMTPQATPAIPRIRGNDYSILTPPEIGTWTPSMRVSVIVPAYNGQEKLDLTLAGLAEQSYPADLIEVIVVDNGSEPPLRLPEIRHVNTRLILCEIPGRANARNAGLRAATGDVIHWLDSDVVLDRVAIEAHMRWHHLAPYLSVTSYLRFTTVALPAPADMIAADERAKLFEPADPHEWIVNLVESTDKLRSAAHGAFPLHVGGSTSVNARLIKAAGPMDEGLILGQDTEMGYRLSEAGAVFIPEPLSIGYHLGPTMRMRERTSISRVSHAFVPDHIPHYRWLRQHPTRQYLMPYVEVEIDVTDASYEDVRATVDSALAGTIPDLSVVLLGPWDEVEPERRAPLTNPNLDLVLIRGHYAGEARVRVGGRAGLAPYVLRLPPGWVPGEDSVAQLIDLMTERSLGLVSVLLAEQPEGIVSARVERTAAFARAEMLAEEGEELDGVVTEVYGSMWVDPETYGLVPAADASPLDARRSAYRRRLQEKAEEEQRRSTWQGELERLTKEGERLNGEIEGLNGEIEGLNGEVERLNGKVTEARGEAKRWRTSAVHFRREIGTLRKQVAVLKRGSGLTRITRSGLRRLRGLLSDQSHPQ